MQQLRLWLILIYLFLTSCSSADTDRHYEALPAASAHTPLSVIALGSCNSQDRKQPLWQEVLKNQPQLWIWLGDNIYANTNDMAVMKAKYQKQLNNPDYQLLYQQIPVIGTWDDHDYGQNNEGKEYPQRFESAQLFWNFMGEPVNSPRRKQQGVYSAHTYGPPGQQVKILLLDVRTFRDSLPAPEPNRTPNETGDILGEQQWRWLEHELRNSKAQLHFIGSGIQIIANDHGLERWGNFPKARQRLFNLIAETKASNVILLSGDRHFAELSKLNLPDLPYPLYDFTTSGLTHTWKGGLVFEPNQNRIGEMHDKLNFGVLHIAWKPTSAVVDFQFRGRRNKLHQSFKVEFLTTTSTN
ncbi:alkaline phosphatase D family protein [Rufibacter roseus]|uniref:Alkaline phosphatase D family protein n=1 Tax=Rufibacter roseus TaxID=1567108 RepID=A0ABW2DIT0_9BACT|nr:alkaline phosphatase D family protein [Rufibacter roseus]